LEEVTQFLEAEGFRHNVNPVTKRHSFTGLLTVGDTGYSLELRYSEGIYNFPEAYLTEWGSNPELRESLRLRNINSGGKVCYVDESQTWWDPHQAVGMTIAALNDIIAVIDRNHRGGWQSKEFLRDFDGYWQGRGELYRVADAQGGGAYLGVQHSEKHWLAPEGQIPHWLLTGNITGLWVPLQLKLLPPPPVHCWPPKTVREFAQWVGLDTLIEVLQRSSQNGGKGSKRGKKRPREIPGAVSLLLSWADGAGHSEPRIGIQFPLNRLVMKEMRQGNFKLAAKILSGLEDRIERYSILSATPAYIHNRNLPEGYRTLKDYRVVLVGAGTIGGFLAAQLCSMGAGYGPRGALHIVDPDRLKPENIARHVLGMPDIGKSKAIALADHLRAQYPYLKIESHDCSVWEWPEVFKGKTLVINATGVISVGLGLEDMRSGEPAATPILHSWIEGHGLASTAFFSSGKSRDACFRCLVAYRPEGYRLRCTIAKYETDIEPVFQGCHQSFFPYLVTASNAAAGQVMTMIVDWLNAQLKSTLQYNILRPELVENRPDSTPKQDATCSICSKKL
jgi:molybdopterin/thiamine biosynthesis adenylyltransferase